MTEQEFRSLMEPLWEKWKRIGVPFEPTIKEYDNYVSAFSRLFPTLVPLRIVS